MVVNGWMVCGVCIKRPLTVVGTVPFLCPTAITETYRMFHQDVFCMTCVTYYS